MENIKLIKWIGAERYMSNMNKKDEKISGLMIIIILT